jgi:hypothetical protein
MSAPFDRFIERVHCLLQAGYATMTARDLARYHLRNEPDITAGLVIRIQQLIDERAVPGITRAWSVVDNWPENKSHLPLSKQPPAKKRKLPDLKFRYGGQTQALYFRFEAKKLAGTGDYADLISHKDGLGRFLRKVYGREDQAGGLLGYVQTESPEIHADRVRTALAKDPKKYRVSANGKWTAAIWKSGPKCSFRTVHSRERAPFIVIFYSFLHFPPPLTS